MTAFVYASSSSQAIPFIFGIVVLVILLFLRFYKVAATYMKDEKHKKSNPEAQDS